MKKRFSKYPIPTPLFIIAPLLNCIATQTINIFRIQLNKPNEIKLIGIESIFKTGNKVQFRSVKIIKKSPRLVQLLFTVIVSTKLSNEDRQKYEIIKKPKVFNIYH